MVQVSPELNSREDATRGTPGDCFADLTLNPWSDAMEIDDGVPDQQTVGRRHEGKSSRHHPRDEGSDSESEAGYETPRGEPGPGPVSVFDLATTHPNSVLEVDTVQGSYQRSRLLVRGARAPAKIGKRTCGGCQTEPRACGKTIESRTLTFTHATCRR